MVAEQSGESNMTSPGLFFFIGSVVVFFILLIILFVLWKFVKFPHLRALVDRVKKPPAREDFFGGNTISHFDFQTLKKATKNFHPSNLLGRGGFGPVFLGMLADGRLTAVKKLSADKSQQGETEFLSEVKLITSIQHKNLVRLLGCCSDGAQRLLVYEYMKNRSLDLLIYGYTAPEYAIRGELSEKADIYSFGVLVLEIISCRKNTDLTLPSEMQYLPEYAWRLYERSKLMELVDPKLRENEFPEKDVMHTILVAFLCLQPHANVRPPMSEIVARLTCKVEVGEIPMRPAFLDRKRRVQDKLSWDTISEAFPSPLRSSSPSLSQPAK
nr:cold-responsive protein kinase 1-like [Ipomoea batatas]